MKPEITKEQAKAIEFLRGNYTDVQILEIRVKGVGCLLSIKGDIACGSIYDLSPIDLAAALINGYEIAKSPEQKVQEYYGLNHAEHHEVSPHSPRAQYTSGVADGIKRTLDHLGIKIEGVNA